MFEKGQFIIYGTTGVCEIMDITTLDIDGLSKERLYYVLRPHYQKDGKIFTPVENRKILMRPVLSEEEAEELIDEIPEIEEFWTNDDKLREAKYKEAVKSCDCREWIRIIKTLYLRKEERLAEGKKVTIVDERYLKIAEDYLYGELAISLNMPKEDMVEYISGRISVLENHMV